MLFNFQGLVSHIFVIRDGKGRNAPLFILDPVGGVKFRVVIPQEVHDILSDRAPRLDPVLLLVARLAAGGGVLIVRPAQVGAVGQLA